MFHKASLSEILKKLRIVNESENHGDGIWANVLSINLI